MAVIVLAFSVGVLLVNYMTVHPLQMSLFLGLTLLAFFLLLAVLAAGFARRQLLLAVPLALALIVAGWAAMNYRFLSREEEDNLPAITRSKDDPGLGHTAVIYLTHGERPTYDPTSWINTFREFDEDGVPFVPYLARPFFFRGLRDAYLRVGRSEHRQMHQRMIQRLEDRFRVEGDTSTRFYLSFLDDEPGPAEATIEALNDGASRIVVSLVFLTVSNHTAEGLAQVEEVDPEAYGVPVQVTAPLWDSETLRRMFIARANRYLDGTPKNEAGVLLVGHGQPDEWDVEFPTETEQEAAFRQEVLKLFARDGYESANLGSAWMEFKTPHPAPLVEEMAGRGLEKILYFSAAISADSIHSQYDVPALVEKARVPPGVALVNLGAWNDDELVIEAIKERIGALMTAD
jgi:hypothetical protein